MTYEDYIKTLEGELSKNFNATKDIDIALLRQQEDLINKSKVFKKIFDYEKRESLKDHIISTNSPKSLTRNAIITYSVYPNIEDWENDLSTNLFYNKAFIKEK